MAEWYDVVVRGRLGDGKKDVRDMTILNRRLWLENGVLKYEADPKHAETIIEGMGLDRTAKSVSTPLAKNDEDSTDDE
eukprot:3786063-Lingulodinium_polyedra.AAC.1